MSANPVSSHLYNTTTTTVLSLPGHVTCQQQPQQGLHCTRQPQQLYYGVSRPSNSGMSLTGNITTPYNYNKPVDDKLRNMLPHGVVDMTFGELQEISAHQQRELEIQQNVLLTKEQRLKYLRSQDAQHQQMIADNDQLRQLRDRVESQELKLKKLKTLKGQAEQHKLNNNNLNSELESIKILFNEKEKELSMAVAKVEQLTKQLEQIRIGAFTINGKINPDHPNAMAAIELEKLRKKLMYHNKLNEQQSIRMTNQQDLLMKKRRDVSLMDKRIAELQTRLKKRLAQQLQQQHHKSISSGQLQQTNIRPANNVAAVEPYHHHAPRLQNASVDETHSEQIFSKDKPKYQSLPNNNNNNSIFNRPDNVSVHEQKIPGYKKTKSEDVIEDYQVPLVVSVDKFSSNNGNNNDNNNTTHYPNKVKDSSPTINNEGPPKFSTSRLSTNFLPKPFGSTHSTALLFNRGTNSSQQQNNMLPDEVRQDGSGQSSPATSESSHTGIMVQNFGNFMPSAKNNSHFNQSDPNFPLKQFHYNSPDPNSYDSVDNFHQLLNSNVVKSIGSTYNGSEDYKEIYNDKGREIYEDIKYSKPNAQISPTINNGKSGVGSSISKTISSDSVSSKPQYASNSVIENTYTTRPAMPEGHYVPPLLHTESSHMNGNQTQQDPHTSELISSFQSRVKISSQLVTSPSSMHRDLASDKGSFKGNTPKNMRRRHSDCEHEEYVKTLKKTADSSRLASTSTISTISQQKPDTSEYTDNRHWQLSSENIPDNVSSTAPSHSPAGLNSNGSSIIGPTTKSLPTKSLLKISGSKNTSRRVCFDPLALLLDASLEGELALVKETARQVTNASASNEEGITPLHNAICAGHYDIVKFLVEFGCDVNAPDSDGWTPLHCAASCNNLPMVQLLVKHGACIFATTLSDHETAAKKCEEGEDGYDICSNYLYSVQEKLGIVNNGVVFAIFPYEAQNSDELNFKVGDEITILRKGDENEKEWWWSCVKNSEGYVPRNLLGLQPRTLPQESRWSSS
ncbi:apoptosis-stimulating of p53 protein 2-like isoform X4 [Argonauta hians]